MTHPRLHTLFQRAKVRHLLIEFADPASNLIQLENGVATVIFKGKQYEVEEKADLLMGEWIKTESFEYRKDDDPPVFEALRPTIALLMSMGYTKIYDPKQQKGMNLIGEVPLAQWRGWKDKNGDDYEYGFDGTTIFGQPKVTAAHGINMEPKTTEEFVAVLKQVVKLRESLGPTHTFILG